MLLMMLNVDVVDVAARFLSDWRLLMLVAPGGGLAWTSVPARSPPALDSNIMTTGELQTSAGSVSVTVKGEKCQPGLA